jgi:hypothetical protein
MANTKSAFGSDQFAYGPGKLYWDTETGGANVDLGGTDSITISMAVSKIELKESQAGDRPADRAVSSQVYQVKCGLSRATLERLEEVVQGFHLEKDSAGAPIRVWGSDMLAQRDSSIWKQLTFKAIVDGVESSDPFDIIDFWRAAPMTESSELVFDASSQRFFGIVFECYKDPTKVDDEGRATYWASRASI